MKTMISIPCDKGMVVHLLRNAGPHRLNGHKGIRLKVERPRLIALQNGRCPQCSKPLENNGKRTHLDHITTVKEFADKIERGELSFDDAYRQLWVSENLRVVHSECNHGRNRKIPAK